MHSQLWRTSEGRCVEEVASLSDRGFTLISQVHRSAAPSLKVTGLGTVEEKHLDHTSPSLRNLSAGRQLHEQNGEESLAGNGFVGFVTLAGHGAAAWLRQ